MSGDDLRALAEAATPGPWSAEVLGSEGYAVRAQPVPYGRAMTRRPTVARCGHESWETDVVNAAFIAAANPTAVLALLDEVDRLRADIADAEQRGREDNDLHSCCYVSGSKALEARLAEAWDEGARHASPHGGGYLRSLLIENPYRDALDPR